MAGLVSPSVKIAPAGAMGAGLTHRPMPEAASVFQGNFSPGSRLRAGAASEWASTRSGGSSGGGDGRGEQAVGGNRVGGEKAAAERRHRRDLPFRKGGIAMVMSGIGNLDADRARIDVALPRPG